MVGCSIIRVGEGPNIDVLARAVNGTITVFFLADLTRIEGYNLVYVDVIGLYADENAPAAVAVAATNTPAPAATDTPVAPAVVQPAPRERVADVNLISAAAAPAQPPARPLEIFVGSIDTPTSLPSDTPVIQQSDRHAYRPVPSASGTNSQTST